MKYRVLLYGVTYEGRVQTWRLCVDGRRVGTATRTSGRWYVILRTPQGGMAGQSFRSLQSIQEWGTRNATQLLLRREV